MSRVSSFFSRAPSHTRLVESLRDLGVHCPLLLSSPEAQLEHVVFVRSSGGEGKRRISARSERDVKRNPERYSYEVPVRGVMTRAPIAHGQVVATVPLRTAALTPASAVRLLHCGAPPRRGHDVIAGIGELVSVSKKSEEGSPLPWTSRDPLLLTAALAHMRRHAKLGTQLNDGVASSFTKYFVSCAPQRIPQAALHASHAGVQHKSQVLEKRVRSGDSSVLLTSGDGGRNDTAALEASTSQAMKQLVLQQFREGALTDVSMLSSSLKPSVEVVPTTSIMTHFYMGQSALQSATSSSHVNVETQAFLKHLLSLHRQLEDQWLRPLASILASGENSLNTPTASITDDDDDDSAFRGRCNEWLEDVRWAHFMVRSRGLMVGSNKSEDSTCVPAIVPFFDMLNHNGIAPNCAFKVVMTSRRLHGEAKDGAIGPSLLVVASRDIATEEELSLNYRDSLKLLLSPSPSGKEGNVEREMKRIEAEQRYEVVPAFVEDKLSANSSDNSKRKKTMWNSDVSKKMEETAASLGSRTFDSDHEKQQMLDRRFAMSRQANATSDAEWAFLYGFIKSASEKEFEASCQWDKELTNRVAQLTDIRRQGRPGEFVVGVPEGLRHLHAERERLQRERYNGQNIFPPQRV